MSQKASEWCFYRGWRFWNFLCHLAVFATCLDPTAVLGCSECTETLTDPSGQFTSPCFPREYVSNLNCLWTIQAPSGFIIQLTFHEFELEEAQRCLYDVVSINTGAEFIEFCGVTAKGLTLNSTGSKMIVTFKTDFSIQKKGFRATYIQVAASLRNQKVVLTSKSQAVSVSPSVPIPELQQFTVCLEAKSTTVKDRWTLFSYSDSSDTTLLSFTRNKNDISLSISDVVCDVADFWEDNFSKEVITDTWRRLCIAWDGSSGSVITQTQDKTRRNSCRASKNKVIAASGILTLAPRVASASKTYTGELYNFRFWNFSMSKETLLHLTCDEMGNVVDWENSFWDIPVDVLEPDSDLSCATTLLTQTTTRPTYCSTPGSGCQATTSAHSSTSTTNTHGTNSPEPFTSATTSAHSSTSTTNTHGTNSSELFTSATTTVHSSTSTTNTHGTNSPEPFTSATTTVHSSTSTTNTHGTNSPEPFTSATTSAHSSTSTTNTHGTNSPELFTSGLQTATLPQNSNFNSSNSEGGLLYRTQFTVHDLNGNMNTADLERRVSAWLTESFQNWNYSVYVESVRIYESNNTSMHRMSRSIESTSYDCLAILYYNITKNIYLEERIVQERLRNTSSIIGNNLSIDSIQVQPVVNCSMEEMPTQYFWKETRPRTTQTLPCLSNQGQYASRKCVLNMQNYTSYWEAPDLTNCSVVPTPSTNSSDLENIPVVSADNAAEVANQLLDFTADKNLTREQVDKLVETLKQIVIVSEINSTLASTVLTVLSNILSSSDTALATSSQVALRTVDALTVKMIFTGPSVSITTPNLAIGISTVDTMNYTGTSFSVGSQNGDSELEVNFDRHPGGEALAEIKLPPGLFEQLTDEELIAVSRAQFAFFSKTGLFQDRGGFALQSFVIASSVGNISINNLSEPVKIRIKHRQHEEQFKPQCAFWDLTLNNGSGGWNIQGCHVDSESSVNETICLCDHLTHFGVLLDISGTAQQIDAVNTKILTFITHIGCGLSAIFSATTLLTYVAFEKLRRDYPSKILMNLSTALFLLNLLFLIDGWLASFNIPGLCVAVAAFLHFFLLSSFTWMGLEAVHMYIALVKVFNTYIRKYMLKFCIIGWGLPALVVTIVLAIDRNFYGVKLYGDEADSGASEFCWINHHIVFYVTCVSYFVIVFLMNVAMFIVVLMQICGRNGKKSNRNLREEILRNLRSVISLTFLLGMTWGFAFFAWGPVNLAFMYLFAIFNSLQGFFVFVFHCALKENVQKQWRRYLCCGRFRLPENSDWSRTITNNTKKVSSENLGKSLSSSSIGSNSTSWTSKFKSGSNIFKSNSKGGLFAAVASSKFDHLDVHREPVIPVHKALGKATSYYPTHSDNFYKNIMMSDNFSHSTKF
ncbi:adhesion G-protein coupled receptor G6 isoform X2 [Carcharodon carcharias]|uniref:adhesion G-protein coupled receptor G6 isoform X2 n=1 Tax=Carcharodon carcharias TaxID=13397 RepID=UPI001B7E38BE|nr:adhesion G-protein coupled receptor G6 isoform X2 [Carcharodon carcharias]